MLIVMDHRPPARLVSSLNPSHPGTVVTFENSQLQGKQKEKKKTKQSDFESKAGQRLRALNAATANFKVIELSGATRPLLKLPIRSVLNVHRLI